MAARQRGMAAELDLHGRREPAQRIVRLRIVGGGHGEGGFGEVVLCRYRLMRRLIQTLAARHARGRLPGEGTVGTGGVSDIWPAGQGKHLDPSTVVWGKG